MPTQQLQAYARRIRELLRANPNTPETALAPAFQQLLIDLLPRLPAVLPLTVSPEYLNRGIGRPDIALVLPGQPPRAFVELKAPAKPANPERWRDGHDRRQYERLRELAHWSTSNFIDFHLFARDRPLGVAAIVPRSALDPDLSDRAADRIVESHDGGPFLELLAVLARAEAPTAQNARHLAELMAHSARLVRSAVQERIGELQGEENARHPLILVRETFRNVLYAHPEAGGYSAADFDTLFSSAFAQTLAFGLLLVREALSDRPDPEQRLVGADAWTHMPDEHPLMRAALRVLSEPEVTEEIGIGFAVMCDTVNSFAPEILALLPDGRDPILYFYEDFLETFDPAARERYGVYYTPIEVVRYMTGALDRALRENLGTAGLRDPAVTILEPATGTGTFLLGIAERVRDQIAAEAGGVEASMALADLARRMYGFELLVGPYAVAHYRLHHALRNRPAEEGEDAPQPVSLPRLGVYLADTLADPDAITPMGALGIQGLPIDEERRQANRIKSQQPVVAIIGNPPYRRLKAGERQTLVGPWMDGLWQDLKDPVLQANKEGELKSFHEFSIAFWRWALWKLFEAQNAPRNGVVAFISNRKFLTGWTFAGVRKMLRERFDRIEIVDLRGDLRAGVRGDVESDQGVFDIKVGTAITLAIADGSKAEGSLAEITYNDSWAHGLFARRSKLDWLAAGAERGALDLATDVRRGALDDMRPEPFQNGDWLSIREAFVFAKSGMKSGRDATFVAARRERLAAQVAPLLRGRDDPSHNPELERPLGYRPLDRRWFFNDRQLLNRPGPDLQRAWGSDNVCLYAMPFGTGAGPAVWCHATLPDYHGFSNRGGYAFPLYDRRRGPDASNLSPVLTASLIEAYGVPVTPEEVFDAVLALLSAPSYARRFAEDLEDVFPHIPFPAQHGVFARAAALGRAIRGIETFADPAAEQPAGFCRLASEPTGTVARGEYREGELALCADGSGRITGIPQPVWDFAVSGYRVLPRWIDGRTGIDADLALVRELRDVAARIAALIHEFFEADVVLADTLAHTLTREALGFPPPAGEDEPDGDD